MRWFHAYVNETVHLGALTPEGPVDVTATAARQGRTIPADLDALLAAGEEAMRAARSLLDGETVPFPTPIRYAPALLRPGKILCIGLNYREHTAEIPAGPAATATEEPPADPVLFAKFANTLAAHQEAIPVPPEARCLDYEVELVAVVGRGGKNIPPEEAPAHIFGYTVGNDLSEREVQFQSSQWMLGKTWDHFAPIGPCVVTADELDAGNLTISCCVNGEQRQCANTRDMIFTPAAILSYLSRYITLAPGDILFTGTPGGVMLGRPKAEQIWLAPGDIVTAAIEGIGTLETRLV